MHLWKSHSFSFAVCSFLPPHLYSGRMSEGVILWLHLTRDNKYDRAIHIFPIAGCFNPLLGYDSQEVSLLVPTLQPHIVIKPAFVLRLCLLQKQRAVVYEYHDRNKIVCISHSLGITLVYLQASIVVHVRTYPGQMCHLVPCVFALLSHGNEIVVLVFRHVWSKNK